jgi:hypothetical protein
MKKTNTTKNSNEKILALFWMLFFVHILLCLAFLIIPEYIPSLASFVQPHILPKAILATDVTAAIIIYRCIMN